MNLKPYIHAIPNWPKKGVNFKDITPLLQDAKAFQSAINQLAKPYLHKKIDAIIGIDARGFIFAAALAYKLKTSLVIIRKKGKLPRKTIKKKYTLEYAQETIEMHQDAIKPRQKVIVIDDLLATGGTIQATIDLIKKQKAKILGISFLIVLEFLNGRKHLKKYPVHSLIKYS